MIRDDEGLGKTNTIVLTPTGGVVKTGQGRLLAIEVTCINNTPVFVQLYDNVVKGSAAQRFFAASCTTAGVGQFVWKARPKVDFDTGCFCDIGAAGAVERVSITYR